MALSMQQVQKQQQRLIMTPQMQQSIQLLQMNSMDLEMMIRDEMMENPFLELADEEEGLRTEQEGDSDSEPEPGPIESGLSEAVASEPDYSEDDRDYVAEERVLPAQSEWDSSPTDVAHDSEGSEEFQKFEENDVNWNEQFEDSDTSSYASVAEDVEENDFTTYTGATEGLNDSLLRQLHLSILGGKDFEIGEFLIGNLNDDGYLDCSLQNLCLMVGYPAEFVHPDIAGSAERVDKALRHSLAKLHGGENPEAFAGMKRREIHARIFADLLGMTYDQVASMKRDEVLTRLLARKMKRRYEDLAEMSQEDLFLEVVAARMRATPERVFDVLDVIQEFEPTGVCARSLAECLRLQCEEKGIRNKILYEILDNHLHDLQQKRFREIAKALSITEPDVSEVFAILSHLDPKPGRSKTKDSVQYITPDVYVKKIDGKYLYALNEGDAGRLKVASGYRRLVIDKATHKANVAATEAANAAEPPKARWENFAAPDANQDHEYAAEKFKNAVWLIKNIEKRKSTVLKVTEAIMEYQKEFLEKGIEHLRPLTLRDIAERVGMHESTIARVTTKKYVETPRGIFELKYFFSSGLDTDDGEAASSRSIKELLTQMIEAEDRRRPLSDQKIADMLRDKGFQIARRTVAKYREQLKILPAKLRKDV